jgi:hypothetical protein
MKGLVATNGTSLMIFQSDSEKATFEEFLRPNQKLKFFADLGMMPEPWAKVRKFVGLVVLTGTPMTRTLSDVAKFLLQSSRVSVDNV